MNYNEVSDLIRSRRSIFPVAFTGEVVEDYVIMQLLENANWAPTHRKTEPWRFVIFKDLGKQKLSDYLVQYYKDNTPTEKFSEFKLKKTANKALACSHVIAICMNRDERVPEWEEIAAVGCAVQNLWLSCGALNLGGYWSSPSSMINAGEFLNLKEGERCLGLFYLGVPNLEIPHKSKRGNIEEKVRWISE